ncbi:MAG: MurR/RpiR family transcriptional regulator [Bacilli bacterium]
MKAYCDLISQIEAQLNELTEKEQLVARYIMKHPTQVAEMTITQLAQNVGVSEPTVTRFCKKYSFVTYNKLRAALFEYISVAQHRTQPEGPYADLKHDYNRLMEKTQSLTQTESIERVAKRMHEAKKIHLFGMGNSGLFCMLLKSKLMRTGISVDCYPDAHMMRMNASLLSEEDLVICVSVSGKTRDVVRAVSIAQNQNAQIITMTSQSGSTLATMADEVLLIAGNAGLSTGHIIVSTEFPFIYVGDILFQALLKCDARYEQNYIKTLSI